MVGGGTEKTARGALVSSGSFSLVRQRIIPWSRFVRIPTLHTAQMKLLDSAFGGGASETQAIIHYEVLNPNPRRTMTAMSQVEVK